MSVPAAPAVPSTEHFADALLYEDRSRRTLQVSFPQKPRAEFRVDLRNAGFRWVAHIERWQAPLDDARLARVRHILHRYAVSKGATSGGGPAPGATEVLDASASGEGAESVDEAPAEDDGLNPYERKRAARLARLRAQADSLQAQATAVHEQAHARAERIPFGQPILIGHHSEGRDRRYRDKIDQGMRKSFELQREADALRLRADRAERSEAISSDDPDAIPKLRAKITEKEEEIDRAKEINEIVRRARSGRKVGWEPVARVLLEKAGISEGWIRAALTKDPFGHYGVASYTITNARGEIARLENRIRQLERRDARTLRPPKQFGPATLVENREANRVQITFANGPPADEIRRALRRAGFLWAPTANAWQRKNNEGAWFRGEEVLKRYFPPGATAAEAVDLGASSGPSEAPSMAGSAAPLSADAREDTAGDNNAGSTAGGCEREPGGLCTGSVVYAVSDLKGRSDDVISAGSEGSVVDVSCGDDQQPCLYFVRWGTGTPSWHDATEISTDASSPF